jgi:predicted ATPase
VIPVIHENPDHPGARPSPVLPGAWPYRGSRADVEARGGIWIVGEVGIGKSIWMRRLVYEQPCRARAAGGGA